MFEGWVGDEGDGAVLVDGPVITLQPETHGHVITLQPETHGHVITLQPETHGHMDNLILRRVLISFLSSLIDIVFDAIHERKK